MDNADISNIALEQIIFEARNGNRASLDLLLANPWTMDLLDEVAAWACRRFHVDASSVRDALTDKLRRKIHKVKKPKKSSLRSWSFTAARNFCKNTFRHNGVVSRHQDRVRHQNTQGTRMSASGQANPLPFRTGDSPEDILLEKEAALLRARLEKLLREKALEVVATLPPRDLKIALCWVKGMTLKETAAFTGESLPTVGRRLKEKVQMVVIEKIGIDNILAADPELRAGANENLDIDKILEDPTIRAGAYELIANSLRERFAATILSLP